MERKISLLSALLFTLVVYDRVSLFGTSTAEVTSLEIVPTTMEFSHEN